METSPKQKKSSLEHLAMLRAAMKQTKITVILRVPQDTAEDSSAAETHLNIIRELAGKQDSNIIVLNHKSINHVNIHKSLSAEKHKEHFQPREKKLPNSTIQISVTHHIFSEVTNFNKTLLIPFLKKNRVFVHFNQKDGLEPFSAIGMFFGPHPELSWREYLTEEIEKTMKADITAKECKKINSTFQQPKIVILMVPQPISNPKYNDTKLITLEIRVPAEKENIYLNILDRLNERASNLQDDEVDIALDNRLGSSYHIMQKKVDLNYSIRLCENNTRT
jgi:hypothetical protein